jgi:hypothetical protein
MKYLLHYQQITSMWQKGDPQPEHTKTLGSENDFFYVASAGASAGN